MPFLRLREWRSVVLPLGVGFVLLLGIVVADTWFAVQRGAANAALQRTLAVQLGLRQVFALVQDAETGQRGYLLTGDEAYLGPYEAATRGIAKEMEALARVVQDGTQKSYLAALKKIIDDKFRELKATIDLRRAGKASDALAAVKGGEGRRLMDEARRRVDIMWAHQAHLLREQQEWVDTANSRLLWSSGLAFVLLLGVAGFALVHVQRQALGLSGANAQLQSAHSQLMQESMQRVSAEAQLRQTQKMEAIGQLTGGLAHDFNNMLAVITSALNLLRRRLDRGDTNVREFIDAAIDGAQRAATLTQRLLAFARQQPLSPEPIDANKFVGGIADMLRRTLGETIRLETVLAGGLWPVHADAGQLEATILNLAVNARDAMPDGGRLTIETATRISTTTTPPDMWACRPASTCL
jgi:CHASE3 domain sensor protein